jgi:hypothetical protein
MILYKKLYPDDNVQYFSHNWSHGDLESGKVICSKKPNQRRNTMTQRHCNRKASKIIQINEEEVKEHLGEIVRGTVQETLNALLDEEADRLCNARTRVVGCFPDGNSALMLAAARLRHIAGTRWGLRQYLKIDRIEGQERELSIA